MGEGGILTGGPWGVPGNWFEGAIPIANSSAIIPDSGQLNANVTDAGADAQGIDLDLLWVDPLYTKSFGTTAAPIQTAADLVQAYNGGGFYFECDNGGDGVKTDVLDLALASAGAIAEIGSGGLGAGDFDLIRAFRGTITLKANIKLGDAAVLEVRRLTGASDVNLTIAAGAETLITLLQKAGLVTSHGAITTAHVEAGARLVQDTAVITTLHLAGMCELKHSALTTVYVYPGGVFDMTKHTNYKTVTTATVFPGGMLLWDSNLHTITNKNFYPGAIILGG
jgi:hypothetical protein